MKIAHECSKIDLFFESLSLSISIFFSLAAEVCNGALNVFKPSSPFPGFQTLHPSGRPPRVPNSLLMKTGPAADPRRLTASARTANSQGKTPHH